MSRKNAATEKRWRPCLPQNATLEPWERIGVEGVLKYLDHTWRLTDAPQGALAKRTLC
jgi:hypothetical protein